MQVFYGLDELPDDWRGAVVTLGVFDGLHRAHTDILQRVVDSARQRDCRSMLITFDPHPRNVLAFPEVPVPLLTTPREKTELLKDSELDAVLFLKVNQELLNTDSEEFVKTILVDKLQVRKVIVGYDYHFGKDRGGKTEQLIEYGEKYQFAVETVQPIMQEGEAVRSSVIRLLISEGQVVKAAKLLGRPYSIQGKVIHGSGRGRQLGFPTANLKVNDPQKMIPSSGIYLTTVDIDDRRYFGLCNVGTRKTFNEFKQIIEVYIMNLNNVDLYGSEIRINFLEWIRDEIKFDTVEELIDQMKSDEKECLKKTTKYTL